MSRFKNKQVLITGGSTGIGLATAKAFLEEGAHVIITGKNAENLKAAEAELNHPNLTTLQSDIAEIERIDELAAAVAKKGIKLDALFLNAGVALFAPFEQSSVELFDTTFGINVRGLYFTLQKLLPHLNDGSSVVLNSSVVSNGALANTSAYTASKAAVSAIGRVAANELSARKIRVNTVSPGPIDTPIYGKLGLPADVTSGFKDTMTANTPLGRFGNGEEVAKAVLYLSSPEAAFVTGADLQVDGGVGLRR